MMPMIGNLKNRSGWPYKKIPLTPFAKGGALDVFLYLSEAETNNAGVSMLPPFRNVGKGGTL